MGALMKLIGITNPWGPRGEGYVLEHNQMIAHQVLDPVLSDGNREQLDAFVANFAESHCKGKLGFFDVEL